MFFRLIICFLLPIQLCSQNIAGTWKGNLTSEEGIVQYELAITEGKDGNFTGYALTKFVFAGVENIGIKKITIRKKKEDYFLEDGDLVYDNYSTKPRRVMLTGRMLYQQAGLKELLTGDFNTRSLDMRARDQNNLKGDITLQKEPDAEKMVILDKLASLNLLASLNKSQAPVTEIKNNMASTAAEAIVVTEPVITSLLPPPDKKPGLVMYKPVTRNTIKPGPIIVKPVNIKVQPLYYASSQPITATTEKPEKGTTTVVATPVNTKPETALATPVKNQAPKSPVSASASNALNQTMIENRATEIIRSVNFTADSLVIRLYDNGEIDGDTVSVLLNGQIIIAKKGLTASPVSHTIYITPELGDSLQLTMYAENLGTIPPNTGLLIIQDGEQRHSINFSGDYQKNSAIILRRRK